MKTSTLAFLLGVLAVGITADRLPAQPIVSKSDISSVGSDQKETTLGDLTADALRSATDVDMAFVPALALRSTTLSANDLQSGQFEQALIATTAPANAYVTVHLKGKQVLAALERSVSRLPQSFDGFLQVSGIHVIYDPSKPEGSRIVSVVLSDGTPLDDSAQYSAAMPEPLGQGGMGYFQAWNKADIVTTSDDALATVISKYVVAHQPLDIKTDGRLTSK